MASSVCTLNLYKDNPFGGLPLHVLVQFSHIYSLCGLLVSRVCVCVHGFAAEFCLLPHLAADKCNADGTPFTSTIYSTVEVAHLNTGAGLKPVVCAAFALKFYKAVKA